MQLKLILFGCFIFAKCLITTEASDIIKPMNATDEIISTTSISNTVTSATEDNEVTTPNPINETTSSTPQVLTPEEIYHPIIYDFISRIRRVNTESANNTHPASTGYYYLRDTSIPKFKYFVKVFQDLFNITESTNPYPDMSVIRAHQEKQRNIPTIINNPKEDEFILGQSNSEKESVKPFNTRMDLSPKYAELSINRYDFFPRYINGTLVVITRD